ncbi:MAG: glycosyltransferase [Chloroflexia bacterium]
MTTIEQIAHTLSWAYIVERGLKLLAVAHFFNRQPPPAPAEWPGVTLLQPVTRGTSNLQAALEARVGLDYPAHIQHLLVCDTRDGKSQQVCRQWLARHPHLDAAIVQAESASGIASKTAKLQAGLAHARCDVVCCVDDDIILRPNALRAMIPYLCEQGAGATFGLACYTDWSNLPSSLMSAFVNSNALLTYIPGTYLTEPFTITGHIFAVRRRVLQDMGGFAGLETNIADDHRLAEKIRGAHLRVVQTPMIYDVQNHFGTFRKYTAQMKRWFVFPRQALIPLMTPKEQAITLALSAGNMIPSVLALIALLARKRGTLAPLARSLAAFNVAYTLCELLYLKRLTPPNRRALVSITALLSPLQIVGALLSGNDIEWRGRRLHIRRGGDFTEIE